jgi:hypothetical protein
VYNLRYHIASLVAVFLALALGLLLGTIVVERGVLSDQQTALVAGLQKDFDQIRTESAALKATNDTLSAFGAEIVPRVVDGVLSGRTVLVVASPDAGEAVADLTSDVRAAGGRVAVATFTDAGLSLGDDAVKAAAATAMGVDVAAVDTTSVVAALTREWTVLGDARALTKALTDSGGLKFTGLASTATVDAVAVTAVFGGKPDPAAFLLAKSIAPDPMPAVGIEITKRADGTAAAAKAAGMSGVDDIETPPGSVALVWVLAGRAKGLYGAGAGVDAAYPTPLFPTQ